MIPEKRPSVTATSAGVTFGFALTIELTAEPTSNDTVAKMNLEGQYSCFKAQRKNEMKKKKVHTNRAHTDIF
jgi:hypothetical protein